MNSIGDAGSGHWRKEKPSRSHASSDDIKPLLVRPRCAWKMLGCGNTRGYELLAAGELDSFRDGRSRMITVESIYRYVRRRLEETQSGRGKE
jgi:hypothetical protein